MNPQPPRRETPSPYPAVTTAAEARELAEKLLDVMSTLLGVVERETELVRAGKLREAMAFEPEKTALSRRYVGAIGHLKASQKFMAQSAPELLTTLHRHHDVPRHAAGQSYRARHRACGFRRRRPRSQCGDAAPEHSEHLHGGRTARDAGPAPPHAAIGQPIAVILAQKKRQHIS
jgi:hypothetical protein